MARMRQQRGFSLPEVMAALLILTIVITVSVTAFLERNRRLQQASEILLAWQALSNEAEYQRRVAYGNLSSGDDFLSDVAVLKPLKPFEVAVEVEEVSAGVSNVTLSVIWQGGKRTESLTLVRVDTGGTSRLW